MSRLENNYQAHLIKRIEREFPGCVVLKNDSAYLQGVPDLLILFENRWAMLEVKRSEGSPTRPNQEYYVALFNRMSYSAFIYPENEEEILDDLQQAFGAFRPARATKR